MEGEGGKHACRRRFGQRATAKTPSECRGVRMQWVQVQERLCRASECAHASERPSELRATASGLRRPDAERKYSVGTHPTQPAHLRSRNILIGRMRIWAAATSRRPPSGQS